MRCDKFIVVIGGLLFLGCTQRVEVSIVVGDENPELVLYRQGRGAWDSPRRVGDRYVLAVDDDFEVVKLCTDGDEAELYRLGAVASDKPVWNLTSGRQFSRGGCAYANPSPPPLGRVNGTLQYAGSVYAGGAIRDCTTPCLYSLEVPLGVHDVVFVKREQGVAQSVSWIRDIDVQGVVDMDSLSSAGEMYPLVDTVVGILGMASDEDMIGTFELVTRHGRAPLIAQQPVSQSLTLRRLPALQLAGDLQILNIVARSPRTMRSLTASIEGAETLELLDRLEPTFMTSDRGTRIEWTPALANVSSALATADAGPVSNLMHVTGGWMDARGETGIDLARDLPDLVRPWAVSVSEGSLHIVETTADVTRSSFVSTRP